MFTGLVEELGVVEQLIEEGSGRRLVVRCPLVAQDALVGASVAVNGCCLTVVRNHDQCLTFEAGPETLLRTNLGQLRAGDHVNLEPSLQVGARLGGHYVTGHIDGLGRIAERTRDGEWETVWFTCPEPLSDPMVSKGSIAVDGVSLTLVDVERGRFSVALIPHTLQATTLGFKQIGDSVNLETDLLGKYVWKCLRGS